MGIDTEIHVIDRKKINDILDMTFNEFFKSIPDEIANQKIDGVRLANPSEENPDFPIKESLSLISVKTDNFFDIDENWKYNLKRKRFVPNNLDFPDDHAEVFAKKKIIDYYCESKDWKSFITFFFSLGHSKIIPKLYSGRIYPLNSLYLLCREQGYKKEEAAFRNLYGGDRIPFLQFKKIKEAELYYENLEKELREKKKDFGDFLYSQLMAYGFADEEETEIIVKFLDNLDYGKFSKYTNQSQIDYVKELVKDFKKIKKCGIKNPCLIARIC